jgi:hypothetical protein
MSIYTSSTYTLFGPFGIRKYQQDLGPEYACSLSLELYIEDNKNTLYIEDNKNKRSLIKKAEELYKWFGGEVDVDDLIDFNGYEMCLFMIDVLEKYPITNTNYPDFVMQYGDAYHSVISQKKYYLANGLDKPVNKPVKSNFKCSIKKGSIKKSNRR